MANKLDKKNLFQYLEYFGYTEESIPKAIRKAPPEFRGILQNVYGEDYRQNGKLKELKPKEKEFLRKAISWVENELARTMPYTKEDAEVFKHLIKAASIKSWDEVAYLLKFGYINNKRFSMQRIYEIINNTKDNKERLSLEKIKELLGDAKKKEKFIRKMDRIVEQEKLRYTKKIITDLAKEQEHAQTVSKGRK